MLVLGVDNGRESVDVLGEGVVPREDEPEPAAELKESEERWGSMKVVWVVESDEGVWRGETLKMWPLRFDDRWKPGSELKRWWRAWEGVLVSRSTSMGCTPRRRPSLRVERIRRRRSEASRMLCVGGRFKDEEDIVVRK